MKISSGNSLFETFWNLPLSFSDQPISVWLVNLVFGSIIHTPTRRFLLRQLLRTPVAQYDLVFQGLGFNRDNKVCQKKLWIWEVLVGKYEREKEEGWNELRGNVLEKVYINTLCLEVHFIIIYLQHLKIYVGKKRTPVILHKPTIVYNRRKEKSLVILHIIATICLYVARNCCNFEKLCYTTNFIATDLFSFGICLSMTRTLKEFRFLKVQWHS